MTKNDREISPSLQCRYIDRILDLTSVEQIFQETTGEEDPSFKPFVILFVFTVCTCNRKQFSVANLAELDAIIHVAIDMQCIIKLYKLIVLRTTACETSLSLVAR